MKKFYLAVSTLLLSGATIAAPILYNIDPNHTYPSFEADHMNGLSVWRGKFRKTSGTISLDSVAHSGEVDVLIDASSIDFGNDKLNDAIKGAAMFNVEKFPTATYKGRFSKFNGDIPTEVVGELTLHGVTKTVTLNINTFLCKVNPMTKKDICGADVSAEFNRADFGITVGQQLGYRQEVKLAIQVEAIKADL